MKKISIIIDAKTKHIIDARKSEVNTNQNFLLNITLLQT